MKTALRNLILGMAVIISSSYGQYAAWTNSAQVYINTTADFGDVTGNVYDFPIPVRLNAGNFTFSAANADGSDIRFSRNGEALLYEIESWNSAGSAAVVWVKMDTVSGNSLQTFTMHWGNPAAASESNGAVVFAPADGHQGVWHLAEEGNDSADGYKDATGNGNHGKGYNLEAEDAVPAVVGTGLSMDGTDEWVFMDSVDISGAAPRSIAGWVRGNESKDWVAAFGFVADVSELYTYFDIEVNADDQYVLHTWGGQPATNIPSNDDTWRYFAATYNGSTSLVYVDGLEVNSLTSELATVDRFAIGRRFGQSFNGVFDEVRVANVARSADWVKLAYETQRSGTIVGGPLDASCTDESISASSATIDENDTATLIGTAPCAIYTRWIIVAADSAFAYTKAVSWPAGRVQATVTHQLRFEAYFMGSGWKTANATLTINETIPEPVLSITASLDPWNGLDTLILIATIENMSDIQSSSFPEVATTWMTFGVIVSRTPKGDTLMVRNARESGTFVGIFCAENGGPEVCDSISVVVEIMPPITVLTPNGGESLEAGSVYNVTWESVGTITQVHVQYQADGGSWSTAAINQENTGTYDWTVPNVSSTSVLLRVVSATGGLLDVSDAAFAITGGTSVAAYRSNEGIVFQIKGLNRIKTGGYDYQRIEIMDLNGGLVKELDIISGRVTWDLEGSDGSMAANGIYMVRLIGTNKTSEFKVLVK
jgi:hypothetical protein